LSFLFYASRGSTTLFWKNDASKLMLVILVFLSGAIPLLNSKMFQQMVEQAEFTGKA
jgi:hypothetical protein